MNPITSSEAGGYHAASEVEVDKGITQQRVTNTVSWGNDIKYKHKSHFRILTVNINGLPQLRNHPKYGTIREQVAKYKVDIIGLSETNLKWNRFSTYDRLPQRTSKWWENTHCSYSYNAHDVSSSKFQPGGTALLSRNLLSTKVTPNRDHDPTGLGRWSSTLYRGQNNKTLRIIQVYRPCKPNPNSNNGVFQQHSRYLLHKGISTCPRTHILSDLHSFITQCKANHEQLIVMGDFNEDITLHTISSFFLSLGMHNILQNLHPHLFSASMHSHSRGKTIIDGIFSTQELFAIQGGLLPEHTFESHHKPLWVDIPLDTIFGTNNPPLIPLHCRRLKMKIHG